MSISVAIHDILPVKLSENTRETIASTVEEILLELLAEPTTIREVLDEWEEKKTFINAEDLTYADVALILECLRRVLRGGEDDQQ